MLFLNLGKTRVVDDSTINITEKESDNDGLA